MSNGVFFFTPIAPCEDFERAFRGNPVLASVQLEWNIDEDLGSVPLGIARLIPNHLISISPPASPQYPLVKSYTKLLDWLQARPDVCRTKPDCVHNVQWLASRGYLCSTELLYNDFGGYLDEVIAALREPTAEDAPPPYVELRRNDDGATTPHPTTASTSPTPARGPRHLVTGSYTAGPAPNTYTFGGATPGSEYTFGSGTQPIAAAAQSHSSEEGWDTVGEEDYDQAQLSALRRQYPHETDTQIYERSGQWAQMPDETDTVHPATQPN